MKFEGYTTLLSPREQQILQVLVDGDGSLSHVADKLSLSENTVRVHLSSCAHKLGTLNEGRLATVLAARRSGLIIL